MHAARKPSSLAEKANSTASTGPITAMMVRDAWLIRFSVASGSVTWTNGLPTTIDPDERAHRHPAAHARPRHGRRVRLGAKQRDPRRRLSFRLRRAADRSAYRRAHARHADQRNASCLPEPEAGAGERRLLARAPAA